MFTIIKSIWKETHPLVAIWIYGLMALFAIGWTGLVIGIITGQIDISNASFGIFDHI